MLTSNFPGPYRLGLSEQNDLLIIIKRPDFERVKRLLLLNTPIIQMLAKKCDWGLKSLSNEFFAFDHELRQIFANKDVVILERPINETINLPTSLSLYFLFFALNDEKQPDPLIRLTLVTKPGYSVHARISANLALKLDQLYLEGMNELPEVVKIIRDTQDKIIGRTDHWAAGFTRAYLKIDGYMRFVLADECSCFTTSQSANYLDGYTLSGCNILNVAQQISVLTGLAKISNMYFDEIALDTQFIKTVWRCGRCPANHLPCYENGGTGRYSICHYGYLPHKRDYDLCLERYMTALREQDQPGPSPIETTLTLDI